MIDPAIGGLVLVVVAVLIVATVGERQWARRLTDPAARTNAANVRQRIGAWWGMVALLVAAFALGPVAVVALFSAISALALRELLALVPFHPSDRWARLLVLFVGVPGTYGLLGAGHPGAAAAFLPATALTASVWVAARGETEGFLARVGGLCWASLLAVGCLACTPALLFTTAPAPERLLAFLLVVTGFSDVAQYLWGRSFGRRAIAPRVSPNKTVEGLVGGALTAGVLGALLGRLTPFPTATDAALGVGVTVVGFFGGLVSSAAKRDAGVKDFGSVVVGHGGVMDRVDSLAFAGPVFLLTALALSS